MFISDIYKLVATRKQTKENKYLYTMEYKNIKLY